MIKSKDFGLCALLSCYRCRIISSELDAKGQVWITFEPSDQALDLQNQFYSGTVQVNLSDYLSAQRQLKTLIFTIRRNTYGDGEYELSRRRS